MWPAENSVFAKREAAEKYFHELAKRELMDLDMVLDTDEHYEPENTTLKDDGLWKQDSCTWVKRPQGVVLRKVVVE